MTAKVPLVLNDGTNSYIYGPSGDPVNGNDPSGLFPGGGSSWLGLKKPSNPFGSLVGGACSLIAEGVERAQPFVDDVATVESGIDMAWEHTVISGGICVYSCLSVTFQGGTVNIQGGAAGFSGKGLNIGWANLEACKRQNFVNTIGGGYVVSVYGSTAVDDPNDWEVGVGPGVGGYAGPQYQINPFKR